MNENKSMQRWRANFYTGLAIVLPAIISLAIVKWLFGTISNVTDILLFFLNWLPIDPRWIYVNSQSGEMLLHWKLVALALAVLLITLLGRFARHYLGRKTIQLVDVLMLKVPLLNKIYGAIKQVNEAFTMSKGSSFKQVVLLEFPRKGVYSVGFVTGDHHQEVQARTASPVVSVFVPTTPNPTSGFLVLLPEHEVIKLNMSVAEGIKFIVSLGAVAPEYRPQAISGLAPQPAGRPATMAVIE
jgi:uncharacterized membrane protein